MGHGFTSGGQESGYVPVANTGKEALYQSLTIKDKRGWFSEDERFTVQLPLAFALQK